MRLSAVTCCIFLACPAFAEVRVLPERPETASEANLHGVTVFVLNDGDAEATIEIPLRVKLVAKNGESVVIAPSKTEPAVISAHSFTKIHYVVAGDRASSQASVSDEVKPPLFSSEVVNNTGIGSTSAFLSRFSPHEPTYGVIGLRSAATKLQFSFSLTPFSDKSILSNVHFAYTQTMFWATDLESGPIRATTYSPELFGQFVISPRTMASIGFRHDSNGAGPERSIDVNRVFARAARHFDIGSGWYAELVPEAWVYVARQRARRDVSKYWGNASLKGSIGQTGGLKLSVIGRGNISLGRGAVEAFVSYPLIKAGGLGIFIFGQGFNGYGETLDSFQSRETQARLGISLTR